MKPSRSLALLAVIVATPVFASGTTTVNGQTRQCTDPCFQAARAAFRDCTSGASDTFKDALDGCIARDHECVDACREQRQDCRDDTNLGAKLVGCRKDLTVEKVRCRGQFPHGSIRLASCLDRAETKASRCRQGVRRDLRRTLLVCQAAFSRCTDACGGGQPPLGSGMCSADAKSAVQEDLAGCRRTHQATASACIGKDVMCVPDCTDTRETCNEPAQAALDIALAACRSQGKTALSACAATHPVGSTELQQCVETAQATAFACRESAIQAAAPSFAPCTKGFLGCLKACPPA
jgi:hypothetical protein